MTMTSQFHILKRCNFFLQMSELYSPNMFNDATRDIVAMSMEQATSQPSPASPASYQPLDSISMPTSTLFSPSNLVSPQQAVTATSPQSPARLNMQQAAAAAASSIVNVQQAAATPVTAATPLTAAAPLITKELWKAVRDVKMKRCIMIVKAPWSNSEGCDVRGSDPIDTPPSNSPPSTPAPKHKKVGNIETYAHKHVNLISALNM